MKKLVPGVIGAIACSWFLAGCGGNVSWSATSNPLVAGPGIAEIPPQDTADVTPSLDLEHAGAVSTDPGSGREQEIARSGDVLVVLSIGGGQVRADVSLDGGASFPIHEVLDAAGPFPGRRLVQCAIAPDSTVTCLYWRTAGSEASPRHELCVVEATPTGFDANHTPIGYAFQPGVGIVRSAGGASGGPTHVRAWAFRTK